jgi:hypothetical protein
MAPTGGVTSTVFPYAEVMLEQTDCQKALKFVSKRKSMNLYRSMMDFLFCELDPNPWKFKCFRFYNDKGKPLKDEKIATKNWLIKKDLKLVIAICLALKCLDEERKVSWGWFAKEVEKELLAA